MDFAEWKQRFVGAIMAYTDCDEKDAIDLANQYTAQEVEGTCPITTAAECAEDIEAEEVEEVE